MVREVKFCCPAEMAWIEPPVCRDSILEDTRLLPRVRRRLRRRSAPDPRVPPRDLAGADWLRDTIPRLRRAK